MDEKTKLLNWIKVCQYSWDGLHLDKEATKLLVAMLQDAGLLDGTDEVEEDTIAFLERGGRLYPI